MDTRIIRTQELFNTLAQKAQLYSAALPHVPTLAIIHVGNNPASAAYVNHKLKASAKFGVTTQHIHLPPTVTQEALEQHITALNDSTNIHGIIVQMPVPEHIDTLTTLNTVVPHKDVDGLTDANINTLSTPNNATILPATPLGVLRLLGWLAVNIKGKSVAMVGQSRLVGAPLTTLLTSRGASVAAINSTTPNSDALIRKADIVISATGAPERINASTIKEGAILIDIGITRTTTAEGKVKLVGDVAPDVIGKASLVTAVPGGVGPLTVASLFTNVIDAAAGKKLPWVQ